MPCLRAFWEEAALPCGEVGPLDLAPLRRAASARESLGCEGLGCEGESCLREDMLGFLSWRARGGGEVGVASGTPWLDWSMRGVGSLGGSGEFCWKERRYFVCWGVNPSCAPYGLAQRGMKTGSSSGMLVEPPAE